MPRKEVLTPGDMDEFFKLLKETAKNFAWWAGTKPVRLIISPEILRGLSKVDGFYGRPELKSEVTQYSPIVRFFKLDEVIVTLQEDYEEVFFHFEPY